MSRRALAAQVRVELLLTLRRGESLLATLGIPLGVLVFLASTDVVETGYTEPLDFLVPGVLGLAVISTAMVSLGIATGFERRYGVLKRLGATPLGRGGLVAAKVGAVLVLEALQVAAILVTAAALGWDLRASLLPAAGVLTVGTAAFAGLGLLMAGRLRAELTLALTNALYVAFLLLGGVAVPLDRLPPILETAVKLTPGAQLVEGVRSLLVGGTPPPWALGGLAAWALGAPVLAAALFRWEE